MREPVSGAENLGKIARNLCTAWRHAICRQAPSQSYEFFVAVRDEAGVGNSVTLEGKE